METLAQLKFAPISAQKARLVANQVRGLAVDKASDLLDFSTKKAAHLVRKVLDSAIANAEHNNAADIDALSVAKIFVNEGPTQKRWQARAKGRGCGILKRSCHITVIVSDGKSE